MGTSISKIRMSKRIPPSVLNAPKMGRPRLPVKCMKYCISVDPDAAKVIEMLDSYQPGLRSRFVSELLAQVSVKELKSFVEKAKLD